MESTKARQLLKEVKKYELQFCSIHSAPSAATFTALRKTITYHPYLAKSSIFSFFDVSEETLATSENGVKAILKDGNLPGSILEIIQISENEREQFAYISAVLLCRLTGMFSLNSKEYSTNLFSKLKVQSPTLEAMGMGKTTTWHGAPDGCCDL